MQYFSSYKWFTEEWESENTYRSAMQWGTGLQFYYVIVDPKVGENDILTKYSKSIVFKFKSFTQHWESEMSYCSAMQWATGL